MAKRTLLVGVRFPVEAPIRWGVDSIVVEAVPISGPIYLDTVLEDEQKIATCARCRAQSELRKRVLPGGVIMRWAHAHRCWEPRNG